jgi:site-specific DNA-methyltransferase (adenine-specific)
MFTLHNGDCLQYMRSMQSESVSAIITDPPYGLARFEKGFGYTRFKGYGAEKVGLTWDKKPSDELFDVMFSIGKVHVIWGSNNFMLPQSESFLVWDKYQTVDNFASAELAFCDKEGLTAKVFRYPIQKHNQIEKFHPTQKPVELMKWCIELTTEIGDTVFDPFMGSGTTGIAALQMGRNFIGCEVSPEYFAIAEKRIKQASLQEGLFTPSNNRLHLTGDGQSATQSSFTAEVIPPAKLPAKSPRR